MQAYVCRRYGGPEVVELVNVAKPVAQDNEVLVRIHATTVSAGDWRVRKLDVPRGFGAFARVAVGFTGPRQPILGTELAGTIESVGRSVTRFKPGNLSFEESATLSFGGSTALYYLDRARIKRGDRILVIGASGAVGTSFVQLAKHFGAHVTGVTSTKNLELVHSLGADRVIDYTREDFTRMSDTYDIIADTVRGTS